MGGVIVHLGSHQGRGWDSCRENIVPTLTEILKDTPEDSKLLLENSAGQNGKLFSDFSEIQWVMEQVGSQRLGWCLDTCHAHAAGYALSDKAPAAKHEHLVREYTAAEEIDRLHLWESLGCIHVNDSKDEFGSGRDRHANLGDGVVGLENLRAFLNLKQLQSKPLILEVPGMDEKGPDAENVQRLKALVGLAET